MNAPPNPLPPAMPLRFARDALAHGSLVERSLVARGLFPKGLLPTALALVLAIPTLTLATPRAPSEGPPRDEPSTVEPPSAGTSGANASVALPEVMILKSADRSAYRPVEAGFRTEVRARVSSLVLPTSEEGRARLGERIVRSRPALVLALGPDAAVWARSLEGPPVVFAMVPYYEKYRLEAGAVTGLAMVGDLSHELSALRAISPTARRIGAVHDARFSRAIVQGLRQRAAEVGLELVPVAVESARDVPVRLGDAGSLDALVMVADRTVASTDAVRALLSWSAEHEQPLAALSGTQVREGATVAFTPDWVALGRQAGGLANRIVHEKVDPRAIAVASPDGWELWLGLTPLERLGGPSLQRLLRFAAEGNYVVRVSP